MLWVTQPMKLIARLIHVGPQRRCSCDTKADLPVGKDLRIMLQCLDV
jgi:hypothetical protein